ncbi:hypothetical protein [Pyrobaculum neutrophilum]|uniref:Uncharacterized protein n=1 Tax=Pyrobaculum neutrophilum (strain DSM 2338 / JCM 9278 / NBRC 100436 / V24Sta) TaxID=444157 RepID=B1YBH0_PYRNV|nr:hypothetical protein [Pyrobaculum neutrophilum]ACB40772.1 hypothetical protein Tneu_1857 [Pyrobaculum neutrophilum V24Sta]
MELATLLRGVCSRCGRPFLLEASPGLSVFCPSCGHPIDEARCERTSVVKLGDCEVRDWDRLAALSPTTQQMVLQALESGRAPRELYPVLLKLREVGALICT